MSGGAHVYILASTFKHLYIGVTTDLPYRIVQHQSHFYPGSFTARYNINRLVYLEAFYSINEAIPREKQLKRWSRIKKIRLIVAANPDWRDLNKYFKGPNPNPNVIPTDDRSEANWRDPRIGSCRCCCFCRCSPKASPATNAADTAASTPAAPSDKASPKTPPDR
jgi:putative endonuclease